MLLCNTWSLSHITGAIAMKILLIEDSLRLQTAIGTGLRKAGFAVDISGHGAEGLDLALVNEYDVLVLDLMLPGLDGLTVLTRLREENITLPILILSARYTVEERVEGLRLGADDYLVKPFSFDELLARIQALVRRKYLALAPLLQVGDFQLDTAKRAVFRQGQQIYLSPREYKLLEYLFFRKGQLVPRSDIQEHLYAGEIDLKSNAVDAAICLLRKKLHKAGGPEVIRTRRGMGYILASELE